MHIPTGKAWIEIERTEAVQAPGRARPGDLQRQDAVRYVDDAGRIGAAALRARAISARPVPSPGSATRPALATTPHVRP